MRVSPVAWVADDLERVLELARGTAAVTHDHPEGIAGAECVAGCILLARQRATKTDIAVFAKRFYGKRMDRTLDQIRPGYAFEVSCIGSVPEAIIAFLESTDYVDAVRNAVSLGGDSDTQACIAGAIAEAFYGGVPAALRDEAVRRLDPDLLVVMQRFWKAYPVADPYRT
jgi:ADP-ribosylglycohydrolase